jgi:hypothetical protein
VLVAYFLWDILFRAVDFANHVRHMTKYSGRFFIHATMALLSRVL